MERTLNKVGEYDYDYKNDIFFFKVKNREYSHSIELQNLVIDFDEEAFVVGLQILNASDIFQLTKKELREVKNFKMQSKIKDGVIQINLTFNRNVRNKQIEYKPIIFERVGKETPDSELVCTL